MINYCVTHFICRPFQSPCIPVLKHYLCVVCVNDVYVLWRGEKRAVQNIKRFPQCIEVLSVDRFDCVWDVLCNTSSIIKLVGIKIYNKKLLHNIVKLEIDRVVNF